MTFKTEVVSIHKTREGTGSRHEMVRWNVEMREKSRQAIQQTEADLEELRQLREESPGVRNIFKRQRQRRALNHWLQRNGFTNPDEAHQHRTTKKTQAEADLANAEEGVSIWIGHVRKVFSEYHPEDKVHGDLLFRTYDAPAELIVACDEQAAATGNQTNLFEWLSHAPSDESSFGATDKQVEELVLWNAACAERLAADPEVAEKMVNDFLTRIDDRVAEGALDESWTNPLPNISRIVIGDIMDTRFLGYGDVNRRGHYDAKNGELTLWPYELPDDNSVRHIADHEVCHSIGGFKEQWLNEGFNEIFTCVIDGDEPFAENGTYDVNRAGIQKLLEGANLTPKDVSAYFVGHDYEANQARFAAFLNEAYGGEDVFGAINDAYRESFGDNNLKLHDPRTREKAFYVAAQTGVIIADLIESARQDAQDVVDYLMQRMPPQDSIKYFAYKHAALLFAKMARDQNQTT